MAKDLSTLPTWAKDEDEKEAKAFHVVIESPRGSRVKLAYDPELQTFRYSRPLPTGLEYPFDWGFIPGTRASDGDPLDAMVLAPTGTTPGVVIACRAIGVVALEQNKKDGKGRERNDRVIAVPLKADPATPSEVTDELKEQLEAFFVNVVQFEDKAPKILGWEGPESALAAIEKNRKK
jgi:inorganic pyrophosphatase